jgi:hypothetical protein
MRSYRGSEGRGEAMRKALLILAALFMVAGGIAYAAIPGRTGRSTAATSGATERSA